MRATYIRNQDKSKLSESELETLCQYIVSKAAKAGFETDASILSGGAIKIGINMRSFQIIPATLGYNARIGRHVSSPKGYKRTLVPTWEQREDFNHLVNDAFDKYKLTANIKSGPYTVRTREGRVDSWDPISGYIGGSDYNGMGDLIGEILPEKEAREYLDSDRLETEHSEKMRPIRLEQAREARARRKAFDNAKRVCVAGFYEYNTPENKRRNGKLLTHSQFLKLLSKLSQWEVRRVRLASIKATADRFQLKIITGGMCQVCGSEVTEVCSECAGLVCEPCHNTTHVESESEG